MRLLFFCIIWMVMIFVSSGFAQIYRYVDQEGNIRFTDNPVNVPEEREEDVKIMEEIKLTPEQPQVTEEILQEKDYTFTQRVEPAKNDQRVHKFNNDSLDQDTIETLVSERSEIQTLYEQIEDEKKKLEEQLPDSASPIERRVYHQQILDLNQRIEDYQKKAEAYREKVEAFNANSVQ
jgi:hypothetical protein